MHEESSLIFVLIASVHLRLLRRASLSATDVILRWPPQCWQVVANGWPPLAEEAWWRSRAGKIFRFAAMRAIGEIPVRQWSFIGGLNV